jgi:hypothetical protein
LRWFAWIFHRNTKRRKSIFFIFLIICRLPSCACLLTHSFTFHFNSFLLTTLKFSSKVLFLLFYTLSLIVVVIIFIHAT